MNLKDSEKDEQSAAKQACRTFDDELCDTA